MFFIKYNIFFVNYTIKLDTPVKAIDNAIQKIRKKLIKVLMKIMINVRRAPIYNVVWGSSTCMFNRSGQTEVVKL